MASTPHLLFVTIAAQGQITPARHLARRLARTASSRVTLATPIYSHRRLFPSSPSSSEDPIPDPVDPLISYAAYSDGHDDGFDPQAGDGDHFMAQLKLVGTQTLSRLATAITTAGPPVTCVVYTVLTAWAADVARDVLSVPSVLFWPQPAAVFSIYYHYFRRSAAELISANRDNPSFTLELPGLPSLPIKDLPEQLADPDDPYVGSYEEIFQALDKEKENAKAKPRALVNTFYELESKVIDAVSDYELVPIGPLGNENNVHGSDLYELEQSDYMEWLDSKEAGSVVYVSFGSLSRPSKRQAEEMARGLEACGRPYLWVVRRDSREEEDFVVGEEGRVVEWCDQMRVLSHRSIGCFVTHCGWNSTSEGMACGVPAVALPQRFEQATNARLVEGEWGNGVRAAVDEEGVMVDMELRRCLDLVMGEGERGEEIRRRAEEWREKAREAVADGGSSDRNLRAFVELI